MIDFVGRDTHKSRRQAHPKENTTTAEKVKFVVRAFPIIFTVFFILNQILEHASYHS
ncbi:hypothetical protein [Enterobacter soli]|uniref:hypothetical protein n=1 Tax=Enterobacter soli TaxID=885040 RepID=UPI002F4236D7